ncbi:MAG: DUF6141 family protein [Methanoregulaceae archaeon]
MSGQYSHEGCTFFEVQRFRQVWIWVVVIFIAALAWYAFIRQIVFKQSFGNNPAPDWAVFLLLAIFGVIFPALFLMMRLEIFVTGQRLVFRMFPLHPRWKEVAAAEIEGAMAIVYRPFREYGGWVSVMDDRVSPTPSRVTGASWSGFPVEEPFSSDRGDLSNWRQHSRT